jgi:hypothetical protein
MNYDLVTKLPLIGAFANIYGQYSVFGMPWWATGLIGGAAAGLALSYAYTPSATVELYLFLGQAGASGGLIAYALGFNPLYGAVAAVAALYLMGMAVIGDVRSVL